MLAWRLTPLAALTNPAHDPASGSPTSPPTPAAPAIVLAVFVVGGLLVFPVTLLIAATAATFGPWLGFAYAAAGAVASAIVTYGVGALIGRRDARERAGPAAQPHPPRHHAARRARDRHRADGADRAVHASSISPPAPAGFRSSTTCSAPSSACCPGLVLMSALGYQIFNVLTAPTPLNVILFVLAVIAWIGASLGDPGAGDAQPRRRERVTAQPGSTLRVMTWNIHGGIGPDRPFSLERITETIDRHNPDVVALQEVDSRRRAAGARSPFELLREAVGEHGIEAKSISTADGDYGQMLVSRCPFNATEVHDITHADREPRRAIETEVHAASGKLRVVATHFGLSLAERRTQARRLVAIARRHTAADGHARRLQRLVLAGLAARRAQARTAGAHAARDVPVVVPDLAPRPHLLLAAAYPEAQLRRSQRAGAPPTTCR